MNVNCLFRAVKSMGLKNGGLRPAVSMQLLQRYETNGWQFRAIGMTV